MADYDERTEDLTERYLLHQLDEDETADFQARMLLDPRLREEVRVMRALHKSLIAQRAPARHSTGARVGWLVAGVLALAALLLYLFRGVFGSDEKSAPPPPGNLPPQPPGKENVLPGPALPAPQPQVRKSPVAANLKVNPALEHYVHTNLRGGDRVELAFPLPEGEFVRHGGRIDFRISGLLYTEGRPNAPWRVLVFSNKKEDYENFRPEWTGKPAFEPENGQLRFSAGASIPLPPGLYYYLFEDEESGEVLAAGKFFVK